MTIVAFALCSRTSSSALASFSGETVSTWLNTMQAALSIWSLKNSPKFFMYILHLFASTTVVMEFIFASARPALSTARATSESLPTPEGSIKMRSGEYCSSTCLRALAKSPTREQQMQPELSSFTAMPASCMKPPSTPISPNSFSMSTSFSPAYASLMSFLMSVVLPAPRKPENISIFTIILHFLNF